MTNNMRFVEEKQLTSLTPSKGRIVIVGSMISAKERTTEKTNPERFFYPNNANYFWKIFRYCFEKNNNPFKDKKEKEFFLEKYRICLVNMIESATEKKSLNSNDDNLINKKYRDDLIIQIEKSEADYCFCTSYVAMTMFLEYLVQQGASVEKIIFKDNKTTSIKALEFTIGTKLLSVHALPSPTRSGEDKVMQKWKEVFDQVDPSILNN